MTRSVVIVDGVVTEVRLGVAPGTVQAPPDVAIGWTWDGEDFAPPAEDLEGLRQAALRWLDAAAEAARQAWITPGSGQALVYQEKAAEAARLTADLAADPGQAPDPAGYPILAASVGIEAADLAAVAALVLARKASWLAAGAEIERLRLAAKRDLAAATSADALAATVAALPWQETR